MTQLIHIFKNAGDRPPLILTNLFLLTTTLMSMSGLTWHPSLRILHLALLSVLKKTSKMNVSFMLLSFFLQLVTVYSLFLNNEWVSLSLLTYIFLWLILSSSQALSPVIPDLASTNIITSIDLNAIIAHNPTIAHPLLVGLLTNANPDNNNPRPFLDVLPFLPPSLPTFDLYGRLLRDQTRVTVQGYSTVADLVLMEILGRFIHECINWLENMEKEEKAGNISDDRFGKGVQNVRPFVHLGCLNN